MSASLETRIDLPSQYKSAGERKIAEILTKYGIPFKYESPVLVHDSDNRPRIWYPDFYLPDYGVYIELYGLAGNRSYDAGVHIRQETYEANGTPVIALYNNCSQRNLENNLIDQVGRFLRRRIDKYERRLAETSILFRSKASAHGNEGEA